MIGLLSDSYAFVKFLYGTILCLLQSNFMYDCFHRFNSAKKDNDFVYHDKIPAFDTLPEIKGLLILMYCACVR